MGFTLCTPAAYPTTGGADRRQGRGANGAVEGYLLSNMRALTPSISTLERVLEKSNCHVCSAIVTSRCASAVGGLLGPSQQAVMRLPTSVLHPFLRIFLSPPFHPSLPPSVIFFPSPPWLPSLCRESCVVARMPRLRAPRWLSAQSRTVSGFSARTKCQQAQGSRRQACGAHREAAGYLSTILARIAHT